MERKKMNSYDFKNQVAVVTGGANGIGFSVADRLSKSGASVKIWDIDCLLYTSPSPRDAHKSRMPSSA